MKYKFTIFESFLLILIAFFVGFAGVVAGVKAVYPIDYYDEICYYSSKFNLDKNLVMAVINVESGFDSTARSRAGARGLMQIMPETATWIANELEIKDFNHDLLYVPWINIEMGCYYLNYLFLKYNNQHKVLFSYNAGEGVMNSTYSIESDLILETVQIKETREYIKKVDKHKKIYEFLNHLKSV